MNSRLSVIVPVYNHASFLRAAINSLLDEDINNLEIIIIDDGSTDGSIKTVQDLPVRLVKLSRNHGVAFARNLGVRLSTGNYVTFFDSDNILCKDGLKKRLLWLEEHPGDFAVGGIVNEYIDKKGICNKIQKKYPQYLSLEYLKNGGRFHLAVWAFIFKREVFSKYIFDENLHWADDCDFILNLLEIGHIRIIDVPVLKFRFHHSNISVRFKAGKTLISPSKVVAETFLVYLSHGVQI